MNALELISKERREQIEKHGYTVASDLAEDKRTLLSAAIAVIEGDENRWPPHWDVEVFRGAFSLLPSWL